MVALRRDGRGRPIPPRAAMEGADPRVRWRGPRHGPRDADEASACSTRRAWRPGDRCSTSAPAPAPSRSGSSSAAPSARLRVSTPTRDVLAPRASQGCGRRTARSTSWRGSRRSFRSPRTRSTSSSPRLFFHHLMPCRQAQHARRGAAGAEAGRQAARRRLGQARRPADGRALSLSPGLRRLRGHGRERCAGRCRRSSGKPVSTTRSERRLSGRASGRSALFSARKAT